jgi:hypothetical protein
MKIIILEEDSNDLLEEYTQSDFMNRKAANMAVTDTLIPHLEKSINQLEEKKLKMKKTKKLNEQLISAYKLNLKAFEEISLLYETKDASHFDTAQNYIDEYHNQLGDFYSKIKESLAD